MSKFAEIKENRIISQNKKNLQEANEKIENQKNFLLSLNENNNNFIYLERKIKIYMITVYITK